MKFNLPAYPTVFFSNQVWVHCPKCNDAALVTSELPKYLIPITTGNNLKCVCNSCGFQQKGDETWSGFVQGFINRACGFCGNKIMHSTKPTETCYETSKVTCNSCKREKAYKIVWYRYRGDKPTDPYFGFNLWLQINIKGHLLWLYNLNHLDYLRTYVSAKLREDDNRHKYSMITNLPQWVKSSKNRDLIVSKLSKLESQFKLKNKII